MEKALTVVNEMQNEGLFEKYAIAGGIAAMFYIEPVTTFDLDIFIILPERGHTIVSLSPLYDWLKERGYFPEKEQVKIEESYVQFIPVYNDLTYEAVNKSDEKNYKNVKTFVVGKEYLFAIMMQTGRRKDYERMHLFWDESNLKKDKLKEIADKFDLSEQYEKFLRKNV